MQYYLDLQKPSTANHIQVSIQAGACTFNNTSHLFVQAKTHHCTIYAKKWENKHGAVYTKKRADKHQSGLWHCLYKELKKGRQTPEWFMALSTQQNWQTNTRVVYDAVYISYNETGTASSQTPEWFMALSKQQNWQTYTRVVYGAVYTMKLADKHQKGL